MILRYTLFFWILIFPHGKGLFAAEACSRVATINYQDVLVDSSTSRKGEGLRYYLEKDKIAEKYLSEYQERGSPKWYSAAMSTGGSALVIAGMVRSGATDSSFSDNKYLLLGGAALIAVSYLIGKIVEYNNESYLVQSIEEYNKRNTPKIYFSPFQSANSGENKGVSAGIVKEF